MGENESDSEQMRPEPGYANADAIEIRFRELECEFLFRPPFGNQTIIQPNIGPETHGFASLLHSRFAFFVCRSFQKIETDITVNLI